MDTLALVISILEPHWTLFPPSWADHPATTVEVRQVGVGTTSPCWLYDVSFTLYCNNAWRVGHEVAA